MNRFERTEPRAEELVSWTGSERLRFLWYRLRLTISEMNYASRRMVELQAALPPAFSELPAVSKRPENRTGITRGEFRARLGEA